MGSGEGERQDGQGRGAGGGASYKRGLEFSDNAAVALLKALAPEKYKDRSVVETVATDPTQARDELKAKLEKLFAGSAAETAEKSEPC